MCLNSFDENYAGCILRHIFTGVPPNTSIEEYISAQSNPFLLLIKYLTYCASSNKKKYRLSPRARYTNEVPKEITDIINGLTTSNTKDRLSVRSCYRHLLSSSNEVNGAKDICFDLNKITFLRCATASIASKRNSNNLDSTVTMDGASSDGSAKKSGTEPIIICEG